MQAPNSDSASEESDQSQGSDNDSESMTEEEPDSDGDAADTPRRSSRGSRKDPISVLTPDSDGDVADTPRRSSRGSRQDPIGVLTTTLTALLQQAMVSSERPMRHRRGRKSKDEDVEAMKMAETSEVRSVFLVSVHPRNVYDDELLTHRLQLRVLPVRSSRTPFR